MALSLQGSDALAAGVGAGVTECVQMVEPGNPEASLWVGILVGLLSAVIREGPRWMAAWRALRAGQAEPAPAEGSEQPPPDVDKA